MLCAISFPFDEVFESRFPFPTPGFHVGQDGLNLIIDFPINDKWQGRRGVPSRNVLPQGRYMYNIVPFHMGWKGELAGNRADDFDN
eukprot:jgi/Botrbrau1/5775/Bobra.0134s0040.1